MNIKKRNRPVLTNAAIRDALPHPSGKSPRLICDSNGLYLQITPASVKSWIFRFTLHGRTRSMGLGPLRTVSLESARKKARELKVSVDHGIDPLTAKHSLQIENKETASPHTFRRCSEAYLSSHQPSFRNEKHFDQWKSTLEMYAHPVIGNLRVADITVTHIIKILKPIWTRIPETAARLRGRIEKILGWSTVCGYRVGENPARWVGHLSEIFPKRSLVRKVKHHTALPYDKMPAFMALLQDDASLSSLLMQFLILTATRTTEARGADWSEVFFEAKVWVIPPERMKAGKEHRVPLSDPAMALLKRLHTHNQLLSRPSTFVFAGSKPGTCLSSGAATALLKRMGRTDLTPHGCRSTFRDWIAERTMFQREVAEACLAHTLGNQVEAAYQRGDYLEKRREVMHAWAEYCVPGDRMTTMVETPQSIRLAPAN